ncbi:MAG: hypothetical protein B7Z23_12095 [Pseudomonadales bacterium 32-61-5]|nr:MAG: hypothetical protein B7Z23_12095 [Pseudomonadales bacterium 32-61-5]
MIDMQVTLSQSDLDRMVRSLGLLPEALQRAARRAVRKTAKWTETTAARAMSADLKVQQKIIRARLRTYARGTGLEQKVWLGLNALAANRLGVPRRKGSGTQVGRHFLDGAFPIKRFGNGVYRRTGADRFPLELAKVEIDKAGERALRAAATHAEARLLELLRQEMNYELSKTLRSAK